MKKNESSDSDSDEENDRMRLFSHLSQECKLILLLVALALGYNEYLIYLI